MGNEYPKPNTQNQKPRKMEIINGEGLLLGRLCSYAAKAALLGEEVRVVNCEKIVISGGKTNTFNLEKEKRKRKGYPLKSAKLSRLPERFVRRAIRGMLPWKKTRGREAFKQVMCYEGIPDELASKELISLPEASIKKLPKLKYTTVGEVCKHLKGQ